MKRNALLIVVTSLLGASYHLGCGATNDASCEGNSNCIDDGGPGADAKTDADGGLPVPAGCEASADVKEKSDCVTNAYGVFVDAASGFDTNAGTKEQPLRTVSAALGKLAGKPRVFVCGEGPYAEHVKLTSAAALAGGYACGSWNYTGTKARIAPSDPGYALEIANVSTSVTLTDLAFEAAPATADKPSSIAVFVSKSAARFVRVDATAKDARDGASGTTGTNYDAALQPDDPKLLGKGASGTNGGPQHDCPDLCSNGVHATGGKGGRGTNAPTAGDKGGPDLGAGVGGAAGAGCVGVGGGGIGGPGTPATTSANAAPATTSGSLTETGWTPADGPPGIIGAPGQGGGGGGGGMSSMNGGGGGGGCGGCGGAPGSAAQGGGASLALLIFESTVSLRDASLTSAKAGNGGAGAAGQDGQVGGAGGAGAPVGCQGGGGGKGGKGGASAGGAGGVSVAILYKGTKPTTEGATTLKPGTKGGKGAGGAASNAGLDGTSAETVEAP